MMHGRKGPQKSRVAGSSRLVEDREGIRVMAVAASQRQLEGGVV
jgi:hypothetical protein